VHEILAVGLHDYLDNFQDRLNNVDTAMGAALFNPAAPAAEAPAAAGSRDASQTADADIAEAGRMQSQSFSGCVQSSPASTSGKEVGS
jgi:nucleoid-associated protein YgaU